MINHLVRDIRQITFLVWLLLAWNTASPQDNLLPDNLNTLYEIYEDSIDINPDYVIDKTNVQLLDKRLNPDEIALLYYIRNDAFYYLNEVDSSIASGLAFLSYADDEFPSTITIKMLNALGQDYSTKGLIDSSYIYNYKCLDLAKRIEDSLELSNVYYNLALNYKFQLDYNKAFTYFDSSYQVDLKLKDSTKLVSSLRTIGTFQSSFGDDENALNSFRKGITYIRSKDDCTGCLLYLDIAAIYMKLGQLDKAKAYLTTGLDCNQSSTDQSCAHYMKTKQAEFALANGDTLQALDYFRKAMHLSEEFMDAYEYYRAKIHIAENDDSYLTISELTELYNTITASKLEELKLLAIGVLKDRYTADGQYAKALEMSDLLQAFKERSFTNKNQYIVQAQSAKFDLLSKDQEIRIANERIINQKLRWTSASIVIGSLLSVFFVFLMYRNKREKLRLQKEKLEQESILLKEMAQVESQALRAQMNPHFIFNALNSVKGLIINNENKKAAIYISKFSKLVRSVLELSRQKQVGIDTALEHLKIYLDLEQLRFREGFSYTLDVDPEINKYSYAMPPMIIQPFVENSIWHGFKENKRENKIHISVSTLQDQVVIIVEDNGVGRSVSHKKDRLKKQKSHGIDITSKRLDIFAKNTKGDFKVYYKDLFDESHNSLGTRVTIQFPLVKLVSKSAIN